MAFDGTTYAEVAAALDDIARIIRDENSSLRSSKAAFSNAISRLDALLGTYAGIDVVAQNLVNADPNNDELKATLARLNLLIGNRDTLRGRAQAMQDAVASI